MLNASPLIRWVPLLLLLAMSCASADAHHDAPVLQFALVMRPQAGHTPWKVVPFGTGELLLEPPRTFRIVETGPSHDEAGWPALRFRVDPAQKQEFESWTRENVGRQLAVLIDGKVVTAPVIQSALPGSGILSFGEDHKSEDELKALGARIVSGH